MNPYVINSIELKTEGGASIPLEVYCFRPVVKPLKMVKEDIFKAFAGMTDKVVDVIINYNFINN